MTQTITQHFGLNKVPFPNQVTADSIFVTQTMNQAMARLHFAQASESIALLTAECGCSKSTTLSVFAQSLDAAHYNIIYTALTTLNSFSFLAHLSTSIGLQSCRYKGEGAAKLLMHLRSLPKKTILMIDEAHLLPDDSLEDLRLLLCSDLNQKSPFSLILCGQLRLRDRLCEPQHQALWQRLGVRLRLLPLCESELAPFLAQHLKAAGYQGEALFNPKALTAIFQHSRGVPRLIQNIAVEAMLLAMADNQKRVDEQMVQHAIVDMEAQ